MGHFRDYSLPFDRTAYKYRQTLSMGDEVATMRDALDIESETVSNRYRSPYLIAGCLHGHSGEDRSSLLARYSAYVARGEGKEPEPTA